MYISGYLTTSSEGKQWIGVDPIFAPSGPIRDSRPQVKAEPEGSPLDFRRRGEPRFSPATTSQPSLLI
jgi:hypothetical protein